MLRPPQGIDTATVTVTTWGSSTPWSDLQFDIPWMGEVRKPMECTGRDCGVDAVRQRCRDTYAGVLEPASPRTTCVADEFCGYCVFMAPLRGACLVVDVQPDGRLLVSPTLASCTYPFTAQSYEFVPPEVQTWAIEVQVVSSRDPFIALQRITGGTKSFGFDTTQRQTTGIATVVTGLVLTAVVGAVMVSAMQRKESKAHAPLPVANAMNDEMQVVGSGPHAQQPPTQPPQRAENHYSSGDESDSECPSPRSPTADREPR
jgi:hypothetical protein